MNNNNGREMKILVVAALIISIVAIGIGFAAFSETLTINGNASVQTSSWKVKFSHLGDATLTGTAAEVTKPTLSDTTIETYNVTFKTPGDSVSYKIKVSKIRYIIIHEASRVQPSGEGALLRNSLKTRILHTI